MSQLLLFDAPAKLSRKSDPITSQKSAAETEPKLNGLQAKFLLVLKQFRRPMTANEVALMASEALGGMPESYRKRAGELVREKIIEECGERACEVTGKSAMTFKAKDCK